MLTAAALALTLLPMQTVDKPTLELYQQRFVIRSPSELIRIPILRIPVLPPPAVMYRHNDAYAVWDERGLTTRNGKWSVTTRLREVPVSPKILSREAILKNLDASRAGERDFRAFSISGTKRIGSQAFFLVRWDDKRGKSWLEALVMVDLAATKPKAVLVGRFEGGTMAATPIDDRMWLQNEKLVAATQSENGWGLASFDPKDKSFSFQLIGDSLGSFLRREKADDYYIERTRYGSSLAASVNSETQIRSIILESQGKVRFADSSGPPLLIESDSTGRKLYWAATGAEVEIKVGDEVRRAGKYVLVWSPGSKPQKATLYDPVRWQRLATWPR